MKRFRTFIIVAAAALTVSCESWLEAVSSTQIDGNEMYKIKEGFYDALTGHYINMTNQISYGANLTYIIVDLICYPFNTNPSELTSSWQTHNYTGQRNEKIIQALWQKFYYNCAGINLELEKLSENRAMFSNKTEYDLIRGELLGLRAYHHFDLMKLFGTSHWDGANASKLAVPYLTVYSKEIQPQKTYEQTAKMLMQDIDSALVYLANDPVRGNRDDEFERTVNAEGYWTGRMTHMNYFAAKALKAKVLLWEKKYEEAARTARETVEEALDCKAVSWFDYETNLTSSMDNTDWTMSSEHLFSLHVFDLGEQTTLYTAMLPNVGSVTIQNDFVDRVLFPPVDNQTGSLAGREDFRGPLKQLFYINSGYSNMKLRGAQNASVTSTNSKYNRIPLEKVSEMYYIMAEGCLNARDTLGAFNCLNTVRRHRGITDDLTPPKDISEEIAKEYYREFVGEGQLFYYLKRTNMEVNIGAGYFDLSPSHLILPYPQDELSYGRNQEL